MNQATEAPAPLEVTFTYTEKEYTAAARYIYSRTLHTKTNLILSPLALAAGFVGIVLTGDSLIWGVLMSAGFILFVFSYVVHFAMPRQQYRRNPKFREQYNLRFAEEGILFHSKGAESKLDWNFYSDVCETEDSYFLIYGKDMFTLIPKRAFGDDHREAAFRNMLERKIGPVTGTFVSRGRKVSELKDKYEPPASPPDWR
jgi:hypothetical protein